MSEQEPWSDVERETGRLTRAALALIMGCGLSTLAAGCGSSGSPTNAPPPVAAPSTYQASIDTPRDGQRFKSGRFTMSGTAQPSNTRVTIEADPDHGPSVTRHPRARDGVWRVRLPKFRSGNVTVIVSAGPDGEQYEGSVQTLSVKTGESPAAKARRVAARRASSRKRLLVKGQAVGLTQAAVRDALGRPDHTQNVAGQMLWYYSANGNLFQIIFSGGAVSQVNSY